MKKYIRVSRNESEKSKEADEGSDYEDKCGQQADDMGGMSNREKRKVSPRKEKSRGES